VCVCVCVPCMLTSATVRAFADVTGHLRRKPAGLFVLNTVKLGCCRLVETDAAREGQQWLPP